MTHTTKDEALDLALKAAYLAGFNASGEGYNGEYPFGDNNQNPEHYPAWCKDRENELIAIKQARAAPVQEPSGFFRHEDVCGDEVGKPVPYYLAPPAAFSCTRSHPHENMDALCELRTEIARLTNENARLKAQPDQDKCKARRKV